MQSTRASANGNNASLTALSGAISPTTGKVNVSVERRRQVLEQLQRATDASRPLISGEARLAAVHFCLSALAAESMWSDAYALLGQTRLLFRASHDVAADVFEVTWLIRLAHADNSSQRDVSPLAVGLARTWTARGIEYMEAVQRVIEKRLRRRDPRFAEELVLVATAAVRELGAAQMPEAAFLLVHRVTNWFARCSQLPAAAIEQRKQFVQVGLTAIGHDAPLRAMYVEMHGRYTLEESAPAIPEPSKLQERKVKKAKS